jgi:hypothetical protein
MEPLPGFEQGRRSVRVEYGLRRARDGVFARKGHIDLRDSAESAAASRDRPFSGWDGDEEIVTRTIVTYTTEWTVVPGLEGSRHLSCSHDGTPHGRTGPPIMPGSSIRTEGPEYQLPHAFRERDMQRGADGLLRYTCPVCGLVWRYREQAKGGERQ